MVVPQERALRSEVNDTTENGLSRGNFGNSLHVTALSLFVLAFTRYRTSFIAVMRIAFTDVLHIGQFYR